MLLRERGGPERATFLELFFDLVFVFALTRVSQQAVEHLTGDKRIALLESGQPLLLLLALLMVWYATTAVTDIYDPQRPEIQLLVVATMLGALLMAVAVPQAFGERGLVFAGAYVAIQIGRGLYFVPALRGHPAQRRAERVLFWYGMSAVPWIAGALAPGAVPRAALWTLALAIDYGGIALGQPTPRLGRQPAAELPVVVEHLSERYRQFFIVALGEPILITGITYSGSNFEADRTTALLVSFATIVLIWRIYIYRAGELLPAAMRASRHPARLAGLTAFAHLLMVIGIVAIATGNDLVIAHPATRTDPTWVAVILGGPALYLAGRAVFEYVVSARVSRSRAIGTLGLAAMAPAMTPAPPHIAAIAPVVVLAGVAVADAARARRERFAPPSPPPR
ncbi:low temperature requirement protein A [Micromonospora rhizosphaerae]|uniref:low temperature requirement protein A n=1 Tax=Micromonospora rhizosphaerae TaxID=568872 RepID=UPI001FE13E3D|nr:low temperature requirement protein A [Micromonospora rhizosphaerae]